jgi:hypothetical protein
VIVPALIAKFLATGAVAQAATGAGVVVVVVTGAGATGVLPDGAQQTFSDLTGIGETVEQPTEDVTAPVVTEPVADAELPGAADLPPVTQPVEEVTEPELTEAELAEKAAEAAWLAGPVQGQSFGDWVSLGKQKGWATGQIVSDMAHQRNEARKAAREAAREAEREAEDTEGTEGADSPEVEDADDDAEQETEASDDDGNSSGKGRDKAGNGGGKGRGGRG